MTEDRSSAEETARLKHASDPTLLLETGLGLLLPGIALILAPGAVLSGEHPVATVVLLISALFALSIHLGLQDSPAYGRLAPLVFGPLAFAPLLAFGLAVTLPAPVGLLALLPAVVYARAARHAWQHLRRGAVTVG